MRPPGQDRKAHQCNIFLKRDGDDVLDALPDAGVDDLEPGIAQRTRDDLGPPTVVAVQTGLGHQYAGRVGLGGRGF